MDSVTGRKLSSPRSSNVECYFEIRVLLFVHYGNGVGQSKDNAGRAFHKSLISIIHSHSVPLGENSAALITLVLRVGSAYLLFKCFLV